jgi:hypothetical protein
MENAIDMWNEVTRLRAENEALTASYGKAIRLLARQQAETKNLLAENEALNELIEISNEDNARLRAENKALRTDAERWRFCVYWNRVDPTKLPTVGDFIHEDEVNEAVDHAIAALRGEDE